MKNMMRRKQLRDPRRTLLALALVCAGWLMLIACEPIPLPGLDAVSADGRRAVIIEQTEVNGENGSVLVLLDLTGQQSPSLAAEEISNSPQSSFSPDGRTLLYRNGERKWVLLDLSPEGAGEQVVAGEEESIAFLANGQLLITSPRPQVDLYQLSLVKEPQQPGARSLLPHLEDGLVRFSFANAQPSFRREVQTVDCTLSQAFQQVMRVVIDENGSVFVLDTSKNPLEINPLSPSLSGIVLDMLDAQQILADQHVAELMSVLEGSRGQLEDRAEAQAANRGETISGEDIKSHVDEQLKSLEERLHYQAAGYLDGLGAVSNDGTLLLFLRAQTEVTYPEEAADPLIAGLEGSQIVVSDQGEHTLYLIDLRTGAAPLAITTVTGRPPTFSFSPDGSQILYQEEVEGGQGLYLANTADPLASRRLIAQGLDLDACWH